MTVHSSGESIDVVLAQLRAEEPLEQDASQRAILLHECGVLEEQKGNEAEALEAYLAAFDSDPEFGEPVEAVVRLLWKRRDRDAELLRLLESMVDLSQTPAESARALWELALYQLVVAEDADQARACFDQAVEQQPSHAAAWLELELLAAKQGDVTLRMQALEARAGLTNDPTWQGLLLTEVARLCAEAGDVARASNLLDTAVALEGRARFLSRVVLEDVGRRAEDPELQAHAVEGQAELITLALEDAEAAAASGVPAMLSTPVHAAEAWIRAGELRRRCGDAAAAVTALNAAAERLGDDELVARLRIAAADAAGDAHAAVTIAHEQLAKGLGGVAGSSLWVRVGRAAEVADDLEGALQAYGKALELDPQNLTALTLFTDLLALGDDPSMLARALEKTADATGDPAAQARGLITVAYVWSVRAMDIASGKAALARSVELGTSPERAHRLARSFAALAGDDAWYEEATAALHELVADPLEKSSLLFELGRIRMLRGDQEGAVSAFETLAGATAGDGLEGAAWLGRALATYAVGLGGGSADGKRDPGLFKRLSEVEPDVQLARGLLVVAAMHAARDGRRDEATAILTAEHEREPTDLVVALFLAELRRKGGDAVGAAAVLSAAAEASGEPALGGALQLEAGLTLWTAGERKEAIAAFENALVYAPSATNTMLSWALRAASPDDPEARLRAIELAEQSDDDRLSGALERLGLAVKSGGGDADLVGAIAALDELNPGGDVALAAALARVLVSGNDEEALSEALTQIEQLGGQATVVARAERYRVARFVERDAAATLEAASGWCEAEPSLAPALEWLASAQAGDDRDAEIAARAAVVEQLEGGPQIAAATGLALLRLIHHPAEPQELVKSEDASARLMNLELGPPGAEPVRRAAVLRGIGASLGEEAARQAARLAAWSDLASGSVGSAQKAFKALVEVDGEDMASWEGLRVASKQLEDHTTAGVATARLANLCKDDGKAAELWEEAGLILLEHTDAHDDAEIAFRRSLERDHTRAVAFDKLFRRVRARKDNDQLLKLIKLRLQVTEDELEITKMYWERARVYRDQGDNERALDALNDVTMLEPDHVGALALSGEVAIKQGKFEEAAPRLARLATLDAAPKKQRLLSGIAAVDLYEKKLGDPAKALEVLLRLYRDGLSTGKVRERLARAAARLGKWNEAVELLERLMKERDSSKGRKEAARLAMAIYRDKLQEPGRAAKAVAKLLEEDPANKEAIQLLLRADVSKELTQKAVPHAKQLLLASIAKNPFDRAKVELVAEIAEYEGDPNLRRAALGCALALGNDDASITGAIAALDARAIKEPQIKLDDAAILAIADPEDVGPIPELFVMAANVIAEAMGPNTKSEDVGRRQRVDSGNPVRVEVSRWMGALGFDDFDVYVGGREPDAVKGLADDKPGLVVGAQVGTPDDEAGRSAVAREVFALRRGTTAVMYCDDTTIASIVIAICKETGANVSDPPYAIYKEIERVIHKAMSRRVRKAVTDICQRVVSSGQDATAWAAAARRSIDRMAAIASGGATSVIDSTVGPPGSPERQAMANDQRAKSLLAFVMSSEYLELRRKLGMGVA